MSASFSRHIHLHIHLPSSDTGTVDHNARRAEIVPDGEILSGTTRMPKAPSLPESLQASGNSTGSCECRVMGLRARRDE
jgi:hypothetical protein